MTVSFEWLNIFRELHDLTQTRRDINPYKFILLNFIKDKVVS